jgi:asparagine synthase (glutamine-hydrolysing)
VGSAQTTRRKIFAKTKLLNAAQTWAVVMCGIAGLQVANGGKIGRQTLEGFERSLFHRGPDAQAHIVVGPTGLAVTRLAIVDLVHGDQPFMSPGGAVLVANGEIYNAPELRKDFADYPFATGSDCEPILSLYETYGPRFADHLRGMFAIALVDPQKNQLLLSRDPFGIKPLYFVEGEGYFAFASEIATLLDAGFADRKVEEVARAELLQTKYVFGTKTIFPHIQRLAPGDTVIVEDGKVRDRLSLQSWPPHKQATAERPSNPSLGLSRDALLNEFEKVIYGSVEAHLIADAPSKLFYSGGLDSTILLLAAKEVSSNRLSAITIGYDVDDRMDESATALELARGKGVACDRIEMGPADFWNLTPRIVAAIDDPMADPAVLPLYLLGRETARQGAKVAICGEGADEIFGGYSRYKRATLPAFLRRRSGRRGVFTKGPLATDRFAQWDEELDRLETRQKQLWRSQLQVLQAIDILERLPNCLLIKLDRALMANGVEGRTPFLDREVIKFATALPDRLKANPWRGKVLLREWVARTYPEARPHARKKGFNVPLGRWMDMHGAELGRLVGAQPGIAPLFDKAEISALFERCAEDTQEAWNVLFYALWHSHFILGLANEGDIGSVLAEASKRG